MSTRIFAFRLNQPSVLIVLVAFLLAGCAKEPERTYLKLVLPDDFVGAFKLVPSNEPGAPQALPMGQTTVWTIPPDGILKVKSTLELADPDVRVIAETASGQRLPMHGIRNVAAEEGVFKLYTDTGGEHIWFVGSGKGRELAYAIPRHALPMAKDPFEYSQEHVERVNKEMMTTEAP